MVGIGLDRGARGDRAEELGRNAALTNQLRLVNAFRREQFDGTRQEGRLFDRAD